MAEPLTMTVNLDVEQLTTLMECLNEIRDRLTAIEKWIECHDEMERNRSE